MIVRAKTVSVLHLVMVAVWGFADFVRVMCPAVCVLDAAALLHFQKQAPSGFKNREKNDEKAKEYGNYIIVITEFSLSCSSSQTY